MTQSPMPIDTAKSKAYWAEFIQSLAAQDPRRTVQPDAFGFGGEGEIADELAALVLAGKKRATASLPVEYTSLNEPLPKAGDLSIILDSKGNPVGIIERTSVDLVPFQTIDEKFAAYEGEGDGSLRHWREARTRYFNRVCSRLGDTFEESTPILCQRFKLVWPLPRIAVVLIHGIGEQRPMATLRTFVSEVLGLRLGLGSPRSRPDKLSESFEVRRLDARPKDGPRLDCYEFYWAHHMRNARFSHLATWLFRLFRTPSADLKEMSAHLGSEKYRQALHIGFALCLIALVVAGVITWAVAAWTRIAVGVGAVLATIVLAGGKLMWQGAQALVLRIVTDAARYLDNTPENIGERQIIRAECVKFIRQLNESADPEYDRIVVIGHSLGSVIAYDALKFLWAMQNSHAKLPHSVIDQGATPGADGPLLRLYGRNAEDPVDGPTQQAVPDPANRPSSIRRHPSRQSELFKLLMPDTKWKISDLVTVGSPLAHAPILFSESLDAFWKLQKQRELPTSPPRMEPEKTRRANEALCGWKQGDVFCLHHAALFAVVEWTNFYLAGDPIGGPLQKLFGNGVRDVPLVLHPGRWSNHTRYWSGPGKPGCDEFNKRIREIIGLNEGT